MSRQEREALRALLAADPALRAAWDSFRATLARVVDQLPEDLEPDLAELREAAVRVRAEAGDDQPMH